jgi:hypothetical protein
MNPDSEQNRKAQAAESEAAKVIRQPVDLTVESAPQDDSRSVTKDRLPGEFTPNQPDTWQPLERKPIVPDSDSD